MRHLRVAVWGVFGAAILANASCGWYGGGGGGGGGGASIEVLGNIEAVEPGDTGREIVVFVYRVKDEPADCTTPALPDDNTPFDDVTLEAGETEFETGVRKAGRFVIAFLLDNEGRDADGEIDPGDPVAVLNDPTCVLDDVPNKYVVEVENVRINFGLVDVTGFPAPGRAEAEHLSEAPKN